MPLVYKLIGDADERLVWTQTSLGVVAWALLAFVVADMTEGWLSLAAFTLVLGLGSTTLVRFWDVVIRSEAVGLSFFILCLAATLRTAHLFTRRERRGVRAAWLATALVSGALTAFARETNAYLLPLLGMLCVTGAWLTRAGGERAERPFARGWRAPLAVLLAFTFTWAACQANTRLSGRYAFPLMNVVFRRVLTDPQKLAYFRDVLGMPVSDALLRRRSRFASSDHWIAYTAPELEDFRTWVHERGYGGYERYLAAHAKLTATEAAQTFTSYAQADVGHRRRKVGATEGLDAVFVRGPTYQYPRVTLALLFGAGVLTAFRPRGGTRLFALTALFFALATVTQTYVCYHGDAMEVLRHGMLVGILLRLGALFALFTVLDAWRSMRACRSPRASTTTSPP